MKNQLSDDDFDRILRRSALAALLTILGVATFFASCTSIDTGTVGVVKHFGAVQSGVLSEGIHFTRPWPFADVIDVAVSVTPTEADASAASKDLQGVATKVTVQWSVTSPLAPKLVQGFGYHEGAWSLGILAPAIQEVVKATAARYTAEQLITQRAEVKLGIEDGLAKFIEHTMKQKGCNGAIRIANVAVTNFHFSKEFDAAIESKVKAEQDSLRAVNEKTMRVTQAEAGFQEKKLAADGEAYKTETESKARAAAIERESKALEQNPNLVQLRIAERWDGKLPTYTGGGVPLLQLSGKP